MIPKLLMIPELSPVTIAPAMRIPMKMRPRAFQKGMLKRKASMDPVQLPVPGIGIPTIATRATEPHL